jgi:geranylgeranyl reductase
MMPIPEELIQCKVDEVKLHSGKLHNHKLLPGPVMYTINREDLGRWQLKRLDNTSAEVRLMARVTHISRDFVVVNEHERIGFEFLVGGDGATSIVRKYLNIPSYRKLATIQYIIPKKDQGNCMEIFLGARQFRSWYGWVFPHRDHIAAGACADPRFVPGKVLKEKTNQWLDACGYDRSAARHESFPINYDYRGIQFGHIFLAGEAAGLASGLTGEGIFQALVSGEEVANRILGKKEPGDAFRFILKYNLIQHRFLNFTLKSGPVRYLLADLIILLMRNKWVNEKISKGFS